MLSHRQQQATDSSHAPMLASEQIIFSSAGEICFIDALLQIVWAVIASCLARGPGLSAPSDGSGWQFSDVSELVSHRCHKP